MQDQPSDPLPPAVVGLAYNGVGGEVTWLSNITQMHCNRTWQDVPEPYVAAFFDYIREKGWIS